jgi:HlyD family secretion protein
MAKSKFSWRKKLVVVGCIGLVLAILAAVVLLRKGDPTIAVETARVSRHNITETVVANGRIQPVLQVKISPEVSGEIIELPVKEGQKVKKGDLLVRIRPDTYEANRRSTEASYQAALASKTLAEANLEKAGLEYKRNQDLFKNNLISDSQFLEFKTTLDISKAQDQSARHQVDMAKASLKRVEDELAKTIIYSPIDGTISKLNSQTGERVVGTAMMSGTEIMTLADLELMEARVEIGEGDIVLIERNQPATLEVDAYRDRIFHGIVTEIANSSKTALTAAAASSTTDAIKFEVKIRIEEKEAFRPGMSVTAEIETRVRTNVLSVPSQCVATRPPKPAATNAPAGAAAVSTNQAPPERNIASGSTTNTVGEKKSRSSKDAPKSVEVVFVVDGNKAKMVRVKPGISDGTHAEIIEGLKEDQEVISGSYKAISRELEDGKLIRVSKLPGPGKKLE